MGGDALVKASENRLRALGIGPAEIRRLRKERKVDGYIVFRSEMDGVITRLDVREALPAPIGTAAMVLIIWGGGALFGLVMLWGAIRAALRAVPDRVS